MGSFWLVKMKFMYIHTLINVYFYEILSQILNLCPLELILQEKFKNLDKGSKVIP